MNKYQQLCLFLVLIVLQSALVAQSLPGKLTSALFNTALVAGVGTGAVIAFNNYYPAVATAEQKELKALWDHNAEWNREGVLQKLAVARCPVRVKDAYTVFASLQKVEAEKGRLSAEAAKDLDKAKESAHLILHREVYLALSERPELRRQLTMGALTLLSAVTFCASSFQK